MKLKHLQETLFEEEIRTDSHRNHAGEGSHSHKYNPEGGTTSTDEDHSHEYVRGKPETEQGGVDKHKHTVQTVLDPEEKNINEGVVKFDELDSKMQKKIDTIFKIFGVKRKEGSIFDNNPSFLNVKVNFFNSRLDIQQMKDLVKLGFENIQFNGTREGWIVRLKK